MQESSLWLCEAVLYKHAYNDNANHVHPYQAIFTAFAILV